MGERSEHGTPSGGTSPRALGCPGCGGPGRPVEAITVEMLVRPESLPEGGTAGYRFCPTPSCPVVYHRPSDGVRVGEDGLTVRVGVKTPSAEATVCYCLGISQKEVAAEVAMHGRSTASARVTELIDQGRCACAEHNPSGRCCLGELKALEQALLAAATQ